MVGRPVAPEGAGMAVPVAPFAVSMMPVVPQPSYGRTWKASDCGQPAARGLHSAETSMALRMVRHCLMTLTAGLAASLAPAADATVAPADWATKMFEETSHSFGTVARGAKTEHRFVFRNLYEEDVHVASVRSSCGCTAPTVTQNTLRSHESAEVVAVFNTRSFLGQRGATITVTFDRPYHAEVQLRVSGNIRGDVSVEPAFVDLGSMPAGAGGERTVRVTRSGGGSWEIRDVRSANAHFEVVLSSPGRSSLQTVYDLTLRLKPTAPPGYVKGQLILVTSDPRAGAIPIDVEGRVVAAVTVSPQPLDFGDVEAGGSATRNVVVRGERPFRVTAVTGSHPSLSAVIQDASRPVHILPVTIRPDAGGSGRFSGRLRIITDAADLAVPEVDVQASIRPQSTKPSVAVVGTSSVARPVPIPGNTALDEGSLVQPIPPAAAGDRSESGR